MNRLLKIFINLLQWFGYRLRVQFKAFRLVLKHLKCSYEELLGTAGISTLHISRIRSMTLEVFKISQDSSKSSWLSFILRISLFFQLRKSWKNSKAENKSIRLGNISWWGLSDLEHPSQLRIEGWEGASCKYSLCELRS